MIMMCFMHILVIAIEIRGMMVLSSSLMIRPCTVIDLVKMLNGM
jgi:hypothetical protein